MAKTKYLNEEEKKKGQKYLNRSEAWNGVSFSLLGDTFVYLLAVQFGAGNLALGYISSAIHIAGFVLPVVPRLFRGRNMIKVQAFCWLLRGLVCLAYLGVYFLSDGPAAVAILLFTYTLFCLSRMLGMVFYDFTVKSISTANNRVHLIGSLNVSYQSASILTRVVSSVVTSIRQLSGTLGILSLQMVGVVTNTIAAISISRIPGRAQVEAHKGRSMFTILAEEMTRPEHRLRLLVRWIFIAVSVINGLGIPFMSVVLNLSESMVIAYSVVAAFAVILAGYTSRWLGDRLGARPLILWGARLLGLSLLGWVIMPGGAGFWAFFLVGFMSNFSLAIVNIMAQKMVSNIIPDNEAVPFNAMSNFVIAFFALFAGVLGGILVLNGHPDGLVSVTSFRLGNDYSLTFLLALLLAVVGSVLATILKERGSYSTRDAGRAMFSLHGLQALSQIERLDHVIDPLERKALVVSLGTNLAGVATSAIRAELALPYSSDKLEMVRALGDKPRMALVDDLIALAKDDDSFVQMDAIAALGSYRRNDKALKALEELLDGRWSSVRSMASKSLARMTRNKDYLPKINELSRYARHIDEEIDFLVARHLLDQNGTFYRDFFFAVKQNRSATFRRTRYTVLAGFLKPGDTQLSRIYQKWLNRDVQDYLTDFLDEARDVADIDTNYDKIFRDFSQEDFPQIVSFCMGMVEAASVAHDPCLNNLQAGILEARDWDVTVFDMQDAIAMLYFGYLLMKNTR